MARPQHRYRFRQIAFACVPLWLAAAQPASAQVTTCNALTMYGWGIQSGTCRSLSPATQNLWVCEISPGNPEIHTTFNPTTAFHITVRQGSACEGNVNLGGAFPGGLNAAAGNICNVDPAGYVTRL